MRTRLVLFAAALAFAAVPIQGATAAGTCNAKQVVVAGDYKVVRLTASHVSCAKARAAASTVARQLGRQNGIHVPGVAGFSMSTQMCTGCGTRTQVSLSYASGGEVTVTLERPGGAGTPAPVMPSPTPVLPQPGPGPLTV